MANEYQPDVWVIIEISGTEVPETHYRVLAGWYGGFAGSDSWRSSSGITKVIDKEHYWEIHNTSGSIYDCHKNTEKLSGYTSSILNQYVKSSDDNIRVRQISLAEYLEKSQVNASF
jgi:hypothetical protein